MDDVAMDGEERCLFHRGHCIIITPSPRFSGRTTLLNITGPVISLREEAVGYPSTHPHLFRYIRALLDSYMDD